MREIAQPGRDPHIARLVGRQGRAAECASRRHRRGVRIEPGPFELALGHLAVKGHFFGEIGVEPAAPQHVPRAAKKLTHVHPSGSVQDLVDRDNQPVEFLAFGRELPAP